MPLHDLYENSQKFGTVIAAMPQLLSRFKVNLSGVTPAQPGYSVEPPRIESRDPKTAAAASAALPRRGQSAAAGGPCPDCAVKADRSPLLAELEACQMCIQTAMHTSGSRTMCQLTNATARRQAAQPSRAGSARRVAC